MRFYIPILLALLTSCATQEFRAVNMAYGEGEYTEAEDATTQQVGVQYLYQFDEADGASNEANVATGIVSDISINGSTSSFTEQGYDLTVETLDVRTGIRYYFDTDTSIIQPFIGGALVAQSADFATQIEGDTDSSFGLGGALRAGIDFAIGDNARLGVMYDHTWIKHQTEAGEADLGGGAFLATFGWSF